MNKSKIICVNCRRESIPKIKVHETDGDPRIVVTETCGFCRQILSQRTSTNEIERIRKDINRLQERVELGDTNLTDILQARTKRYNILRRELAQ